MFCPSSLATLSSMSEIRPRVDMSPAGWSDAGMSDFVPTGTVTLLLADAEGSTPLWETVPEEMTAAFANLDRTLAELVPAHHGVRPVEQGEGDSFVVAFTRATDAIACALALQRAPLAPIRLRIGLHTGEVRLRELAHGGQTVLSGTTGDLAADLLPDGAWLTDLGTGQRGAGQQGDWRQTLRLPPHGADPPHARLHQTQPRVPGAACAGSGPSH